MMMISIVISFVAGFVFSCVISAGTISDLYDEIERLEGREDDDEY